MNGRSQQRSNAQESLSQKKIKQFSKVLRDDSRVHSTPRFVATLYAEPGDLFLIKIYPSLKQSLPGSELMTICRVRAETEHEIRFDERFAISLHFKSQTDEMRAEFAGKAIQEQGGIEKLKLIFGLLF